jgi:putative ABC transport system permease protein
MMLRLNLRTRKVLRDIWGNKTRALLVVVSIAVGLLAMSTVFRAQAILARDVQASLAASNPAEATLLTQPIGDDTVDVARQTEEVEEAEGRQTVWGRVKAGEAGDWRTIKLVALDDYDDIRLNKIAPESGAWPPPDRTLLIERSCLSAAGVQIGDEVIVEAPNGEQRQMPITGLVHDMNVVSGELVDQVLFGYITMDTLDWFDLPPGFTQVDLGVAGDNSDQAHVRQVAEQASDRVEETGRLVFGIKIPEPNKHVMDYVIQSLLLMLGSLGLLSLVLSGFLIFNTVSAILARQVRQVGVMKAIGAPQRDVLAMYLAMVLIFSFMALAIALPAGMLGSRLLSLQLAHLLNIDVQGFDVPPYVLALEILTALIVPLIATLYPILNGTHITVREAISSQDAGAGQFGASRIDAWLGRLRGLPATLLYACRNIFRRKVRLLLTLLTLSMGGAIFITVLSVRASLFLTVESIAAYWQQDLSVDFQRPYPTDRIEQEVMAVSGVVDLENWSVKSAFRQRPDGSESGEPIGVFAIPANSRFVRPTLLEGRWLRPGDTDAVVVNIDFAHKESDVHLDDWITLKIEDHETTWQVVGVCTTQMVGAGEPVPEQAMAYVNYSHLVEVVGETGLANRAAVATDRHDATYQAEMKRTLEDRLSASGFNLRSVETNAKIRSQVENLTNPLLLLLAAMAGLFAVVGGLSLTGAMSLNVLERTQEIGIIRAVGASSKIVMQIVIIEGIIIGLVSWLIASLLAFPLGKIMTVMVGISFIKVPLDYAFAPTGIGLWLIIVLMLSVFASYLPANNATRIVVREALVYE